VQALFGDEEQLGVRLRVTARAAAPGEPRLLLHDELLDAPAMQARLQAGVQASKGKCLNFTLPSSRCRQLPAFWASAGHADHQHGHRV